MSKKIHNENEINTELIKVDKEIHINKDDKELKEKNSSHKNPLFNYEIQQNYKNKNNGIIYFFKIIS